jgi:hypothetical protein
MTDKRNAPSSTSIMSRIESCLAGHLQSRGGTPVGQWQNWRVAVTRPERENDQSPRSGYLDRSTASRIMPAKIPRTWLAHVLFQPDSRARRTCQVLPPSHPEAASIRSIDLFHPVDPLLQVLALFVASVHFNLLRQAWRTACLTSGCKQSRPALTTSIALISARPSQVALPAIPFSGLLASPTLSSLPCCLPLLSGFLAFSSLLDLAWLCLLFWFRLLSLTNHSPRVPSIHSLQPSVFWNCASPLFGYYIPVPRYGRKPVLLSSAGTSTCRRRVARPRTPSPGISPSTTQMTPPEPQSSRIRILSRSLQALPGSRIA